MPPYLKKIKEEDPEELQKIRDKGLETRRAKTDKIKNIKDIIKGELSVCIALRDKNGQYKKDKNGKLILITKKELMALKVIDRVIENGNVKDLIEIGELIGDIDKKQENNINLFFDSVRKEILNEEN